MATKSCLKANVVALRFILTKNYRNWQMRLGGKQKWLPGFMTDGMTNGRNPMGRMKEITMLDQWQQEGIHKALHSDEVLLAIESIILQEIVAQRGHIDHQRIVMAAESIVALIEEKIAW